MTDELNLTTEQFIITLAIIVIVLALLLWYTGRQTWLELPLDDRTEDTTTDTVKARYGAYIQSRADITTKRGETMTETPQQTLTEKERAVLSLIPVGAENLRNGRYIAKALNLNLRTFRDIIQRLIVKHGVPIVAKRGLVSGYYIPMNERERLDGIKELNAQHQQEYRRLNALINADLNRHKELMTDEAIE